MKDSEPGDVVRGVFIIFLGLMLCACVGVGVWTFYPAPDRYSERNEVPNRREQELRDQKLRHELTDADKNELWEIEQERTRSERSRTLSHAAWAQLTSVALVVCSVLIMAVSLTWAARMPVIGDGLLLGGVFTMFYGVVVVISEDTSINRFLIMTVVLVITLGLGYVRFVRRGKVAPLATAAGSQETHGLMDIERRVHGLEERMNEAARAFGHRHDGPGPV